MSTASSRSSSPGNVRARDIDRAQAAGRLDAAYAEGQLGADEYHDRVARAAAARTLGELHELTTDLQAPAGRPAATQFPGAATGPVPSETGSRNPLRSRRFADGYPGHVRARDSDRERTVAMLDAARVDGQLDQDEHGALTALAAEARTLDDLAELVADLQQRASTPRPAPPRSSRALVLWTAVGVAAIAVAVGTFTLTGPAERPAPAEPVTVADPSAVQPLVIATPDLVTPEGIRVFLDRYRAKFGDVVADEVRLDADGFATVERMAPEGAKWAHAYDYRGGFKRSSGPDLRSRDTDTVPVDLAILDLAAIGAAASQAPPATKVPGGAVSSITVSVADHGPWLGRPLVDIAVRNERGEHGTVTVTPTGEVLKVTEVR